MIGQNYFGHLLQVFYISTIWVFVLMLSFSVLERVLSTIPNGSPWSFRKFQFSSLYYWYLQTFCAVASLDIFFFLSRFSVVQKMQLSNYFPDLPLFSFWVVLVFFFLADFVGYLVHRFIAHGIHWKYHVVHHRQFRVDFYTTFITHPVEAVMGRLIRFPGLLLVGADMRLCQIIMIIDLFWSAFQHSSIEVKQKWFSTVFMTPSLHRLHHSNVRAVYSSNFSPFFTFWDRFFHTLVSEEKAKELGAGEFVGLSPNSTAP